MGESINLWHLFIEMASLVSGIATPWLVILYRKRQSTIERLIGSLEEHKADDRKHFKRIKKALREIASGYQPRPPTAPEPRPIRQVKSGE